jgi:hypothetical protein
MNEIVDSIFVWQKRISRPTKKVEKPLRKTLI